MEKRKGEGQDDLIGLNGKFEVFACALTFEAGGVCFRKASFSSEAQVLSKRVRERPQESV